MSKIKIIELNKMHKLLCTNFVQLIVSENTHFDMGFMQKSI